ncbi:MAG: TIGR02996 domain-containing protein [Gemmataceae bacterium]|nr:TIGR02996 domain-containing protein [Gemmataceae bacterium]
MDLRRAFAEDVIDHPEDDAPRLVFADWLDEQGEAAHAEFVRLQVALARGGATAAMLDREQELLEAHRAEWAADLQGTAHEVLFRRGFVEGIEVVGRHERLPAALAAWAERHPVRLLRLDEAGDEPNAAVASLLEEGRLRLEGLDIDMEQDDPPGWLERVWRSPGAAGPLRSLLVEHEARAEAWDRLVERIAAAPGPLADLVELGLGFGTVSEPLSERAVEAVIGSAGFLALRKLHLPFSRFGAEAAAALGHAPRWAGLTHLDLGCCHIPEDGWRRFAEGPNAARLEWLGLIGGHVEGDEGWDTLGDHPCGQALAALLGDRADYITSSTFPRWKGVRL